MQEKRPEYNFNMGVTLGGRDPRWSLPTLFLPLTLFTLYYLADDVNHVKQIMRLESIVYTFLFDYYNM